MKAFILFTMCSVLLVLTGCNKEKLTARKAILGEWQLIEQRLDPGTGNGTFQAVTSDKKIKFLRNGKFKANGKMCIMSSESGPTSSGSYDSSTGIFYPDECVNTLPLEHRYSVDGNTLILTYPCDCGCQQKYERL